MFDAFIPVQIFIEIDSEDTISNCFFSNNHTWFLLSFPKASVLDLAMLISKLFGTQYCQKESNNLWKPMWDCDINTASFV